ncbi:TonB-dependent receptor [Luteolibacter sp. AS25]|uniref:TonB-dependent receptor n=1 Tax=Luteolibacter sp. AS25 TaxID=3135776 RepID=UPI00398AF705
MKFPKYLPILLSSTIFPATARETAEIGDLDTLVITGKAESLIGSAGTASKGQANREELLERPYLRRGELLEVVPGVVITQHSGDGKANQYFVRGFNLDHGTDFSIRMDGQPVNFVTHAHGQGYADLNPLIPELVDSLDYLKGPFTAELGDLSTAGGARFNFIDTLPQGIASVGIGENNYFRGLLADTIDISPANDSGDRSALTYALEYNYYDGPWDKEGNSQRINAFLKYFQQSGQDTFSITAMAYDADWDSTDQVPTREIRNGGIDRLGNIDDSVRGDSSRYSLMAEWERELTDGKVHADVYFGRYDMDLFSNFTYFLNDPVNGDQFEQEDGRWFLGGEVNRLWEFGGGNTLTVGLQTRNDFISDIGLYNTTDTVRTSTVRVDDVTETSVGVYATGNYVVNDWFRMQPGLRADAFYFDVDSDDPRNSGTETDGIVSPKLNLVFGPWQETEIYASAGMGFHSNDARGVTITVDPATGLAADSVDPLVRTYGYELGVRTEAFENIVSTVSLFYLHSDSELLYVGDAGTSEAGPATERYGIEWSTYWRPNEWLMIDNELTLSEGKLLGVGSENEIPGSVPFTINTGITVGRAEGLFGSLRSRYFSPRPLTEDGTVDSRQSWQINGRLGYRKNDWEVAVDVLNILGRDDNDIEYFYTSRLPGEAAGGVDDIHLHPAEPRTVRLTLTRHF